MWQELKYYFFKSLWVLFSSLPLGVMYLLSDLFYYPFYYLIRYRRKVVRQNLSECFPEKTAREIIRIEKKFYHHFIDLLFESLKVMTLSKKSLMKRALITNPELLEELLRQQKSVSLFMGHYANWEWYVSLPLFIKTPFTFGQVYQRLHNPVFNRLILENRESTGGVGVEMNKSLRWISERIKNKEVIMVPFLADQAPRWNSIHHWVDFLHHDTAVYTGAEKITKRFGMEALYFKIQRVGRGRYEATFIRLHEDPQVLPDFELTDIYYRQLEQDIRECPEYYLWSHKRFKRTREEFNRRKQNKA